MQEIRWVVPVTIVLLIATIWAFTGSEAVARNEPGVRVAPGDAYNPIAAGEDLPDGFRQLLPRDAILPIYEPEFVSAAETVWPDATQVIGVSINGESKAYPVSVLNGRELVVDELDGIPILVSW